MGIYAWHGQLWLTNASMIAGVLAILAGVTAGAAASMALELSVALSTAIGVGVAAAATQILHRVQIRAWASHYGRRARARQASASRQGLT